MPTPNCGGILEHQVQNLRFFLNISDPEASASYECLAVVSPEVPNWMTLDYLTVRLWKTHSV